MLTSTVLLIIVLSVLLLFGIYLTLRVEDPTEYSRIKSDISEYT